MVSRGFLLPHTKESLSSTESIIGASHLGLPREVLTSFRNKSRGRQRREKKHWRDQCEKAEWQPQKNREKVDLRATPRVVVLKTCLPTWGCLDFFSQILPSAAINVHSRDSPGDTAGEGCVHLWLGHQEHGYSAITSDAMVEMEVQRTREQGQRIALIDPHGGRWFFKEKLLSKKNVFSQSAYSRILNA